LTCGTCGSAQDSAGARGSSTSNTHPLVGRS
jgi:hypothetical protein